MTNIEIVEVTNIDGTTSEHVIIHHGNDQFTSMPKAIYDEQVVAQNEAAPK